MSNFIKNVRFDPVYNNRPTFDRNQFFADLILLPAQFAYVTDNTTGTVPLFKGLDQCLGYEMNEMDVQFLLDYIHPEDRELMNSVMQKAVEYTFQHLPNEPFSMHLKAYYRVMNAQGNPVRVFRQSTVLEADDLGRPVSFLSIVNDISAFDKSKSIKFKMEGKNGKELYVPEFPMERYDISGITPTEKELILLIAKGLSTKQIATQLNKSTHTVETQRKTMLRKFGMKNTFQLIYRAKEEGII